MPIDVSAVAHPPARPNYLPSTQPRPPRLSRLCHTSRVFRGFAFALVIAQSATGGHIDLWQQPVADKQAETYWLEPEGDGLVYRGPEFGAHVAEDGRVRFEDKAKAKPMSYLPMPAPSDTPTLQGAVRKWLGGRPRKPAPSGDLAPPPQALGYCPPNYADSCESNRRYLPSYANKHGILVNAGVFVDWENHLVRIPAKDEARVEKARFLAATFTMRTRMAEQARNERLKAVLTDLPSLLSAIWYDRAQPAHERRKILHELWKEFAEVPGNESACATVMAFIRRRLPAGGPDAFSKEELNALRADGNPAFDPYGP